MAEILPRHYIIGIIFFVLIIVSGIGMIDIFQQTNESFIDGEQYHKFNNTFNVMSELTTEVSSLRSGVEGASTDFGLFGVLNSLISTSWNTLKLLINSFSFMDAVFGGLYTVFGIPAYIGNMIILAVTVILLFAIFSAIFQRDI